ncbi:uncharacterized protein LOC125945744 [Dermacentor silvarum]|uniref:uncharacterized protein LOC125945744 n=1 Tax=Dermacentor silvarum TaxID=543639 RepID=UPI002101B078|nr:uncharacterized protein LOC125945744 [Dermacentor silvarum]
MRNKSASKRQPESAESQEGNTVMKRCITFMQKKKAASKLLFQTCSKEDGASIKQHTPRTKDELLPATTRPLCGLWLLLQESLPSTPWSSSQEPPSTLTERGWSRICKDFTPQTKKRMQKHFDEISSVRRTVSRLKRASAIIPPARILAESSRYLNKDFLEILHVEMHLQPLNKHGRRWPKEFSQFTLP